MICYVMQSLYAHSRFTIPNEYKHEVEKTIIGTRTICLFIYDDILSNGELYLHQFKRGGGNILL